MHKGVMHGEHGSVQLHVGQGELLRAPRGSRAALSAAGPGCTQQTQPGLILHGDTGPQGSSCQEDTGGTSLSFPTPPHSLLSQK